MPLQEIDIPPLPCLDELVLKTTRHPGGQLGHGELFSCTVNQGQSDHKVSPVEIPPSVTQQLDKAPSLRRITMPTVLYPKQSHFPEYCAWDGQGCPVTESIEIYRYSLPEGQLTHCISLSHVIRDADGDTLHLSQMVRQDWTDYRLNVLNEHQGMQVAPHSPVQCSGMAATLIQSHRKGGLGGED